LTFGYTFSIAKYLAEAALSIVFNGLPSKKCKVGNPTIEESAQAKYNVSKQSRAELYKK
jgi:hypothetical protein